MSLLNTQIAANIWNSFDISKDEPDQIAHYTSIDTLEKIVTKNEIWLSNPLYMNDTQELHHGIDLGIQAIKNSDLFCNAFDDKLVHTCFLKHLNDLLHLYANKHVLDTYIMCFSTISPKDNDGSLTMWRGYGDQGNGAAIVFDMSKLVYEKNSPLFFCKVKYLSDDEHSSIINKSIEVLIKSINATDYSKESINAIAERWFDGLKIYSLTNKYIGFEDEKEWRLVYCCERNNPDSLAEYYDYFITNGSIEPKLKLPVKTIPGIIDKSNTLENLIDRIILGPSQSNRNALSEKVINRMLESKMKTTNPPRVRASKIPYRHK